MSKYGKLKRGFLKFSDLIQDPRNPIRAIEQFLRSPSEPEAVLEPDCRVKVSLTVDIEHDYGLKSTLGELSTVEKGMNNLMNIYDDTDISGTFVVSNPIVENFQQLVEEVSEKHEVGVHGYNHECWSSPKWWISDSRILTREEKMERANEMRESIEEITSEAPKSFRAPYMAIDMEALTVLEDLGFEYDSSDPSYYGVFPKYYHPDELSIQEIPISADPRPHFKILPIPHAEFNWLNTKLISKLGIEKTADLVAKILRYQKIERVEPHIVLLMHQWEFVDSTNIPGERFEYASFENRNVLEEFVDELRKGFGPEFLPMEKLKLK